MKKPVDYAVFKKMSAVSKKEYIQELQARFNVPRNEVASMLGCADSTLANIYRNLGLPAARGGNHKWNEDEWISFLDDGDGAASDVQKIEAVVEEKKEEISAEKKEEIATETSHRKEETVAYGSGLSIDDLIKRMKELGCKAKISIEIEV